jgi:hypothetical protein
MLCSGRKTDGFEEQKRESGRMTRPPDDEESLKVKTISFGALTNRESRKSNGTDDNNVNKKKTKWNKVQM